MLTWQLLRNVTTQVWIQQLYEYLSKVGQSVLYCDKDSVVYVQKVGNPSKLTTGNNLVDLTDELEEFGSGSFIDQFVSGGPKNYAFLIICPLTGKRKTKCKIKGISLNYKHSKVSNITATGAFPQSSENQKETCWRRGVRGRDQGVHVCLQEAPAFGQLCLLSIWISVICLFIYKYRYQYTS